VSDWGCRGLRINDQHYNDREQKLKRTEHIKQSARMGFTNQNASPASESGREEVHQQVPLQAPRKVYKDMGIACIPLPRKRTDEEERVHRQSNAAWFVSHDEEQRDGKDVCPPLP